MPFGLTNAPASFQSWMNHIFKPLLRKSVLVFFHDILVYSPSMETHIIHLTHVFQLMIQHSLADKRSKCYCGQDKVDYLGHFISGKGVETDPQKIKAILTWSAPKNVKELRRFLGLAGYYRKFIKRYAWMSKPLTQLLKKGNFTWSEDAQFAFEKLRSALNSTPVLALLDFSQTFIIEADASQGGIGAVLMQEQHPIAYLSSVSIALFSVWYVDDILIIRDNALMFESIKGFTEKLFFYKIS